MSERIHFEEKQYLGYNKFSFILRMMLAIFCFLANYKADDINASGELFFIVGISILIISLLLIFVLHLETTVTDTAITLDGLWTARKVKVDLNSIVSVEEVPYSKYYLNRSVYNLHRKGTIRFYTRGNRAVKLVDKDGLTYLIGSQKASELAKVLKERI